ncbi:hypothetical protein ACFP3R_24245 [Saccharothrix lopnurensis]|uniref:Uncharacterized protein n=2 Tax=Saccharothrix lopnurensis TaxID=1670621 RepID=A0ABW1P9Y7_9PSEU
MSNRAHRSALTGHLVGAGVDRRDFLRWTGLAFGSAVALTSCSAKEGEPAATTTPPPATAEGPFPATTPQVSRNYSYVTVKHPESVKTTVFGINNRDETVGYFADGRGVHGFLRSAAGEFSQVVDHPEAGDTTALYGLNNNGDAVGYYQPGKGSYPGTMSLPAEGVSSFTYSSTTKGFESIDTPEDGTGTVVAFGINDSGLVSGWYFARDESGQSQAIIKGFVWSKGERKHVDTFRHPDDAGEGTFFMGINNAGLVVGQYIGEGKAAHAFVRDSNSKVFAASPIDHPDVPASEGGTSGLGISDLGVIAGFYLGKQGPQAYLRAGQDEFIPLNYAEAASGMSACGINTSGKVVGDFYDSRGDNLGYIATPV